MRTNDLERAGKKEKYINSRNQLEDYDQFRLLNNEVRWI
jgi:hypothetical protein